VALQNNSKIIVPEGNALSLILAEAEHLGKKLVVPLPPKDMPNSTTKG